MKARKTNIRYNDFAPDIYVVEQAVDFTLLHGFSESSSFRDALSSLVAVLVEKDLINAEDFERITSGRFTLVADDEQ